MKSELLRTAIFSVLFFGCGKENGNSQKIPSPVQEKSVSNVVINEQKNIQKLVVQKTFSFTEALSNSTCQGIFVGKQIFLTPAHCFESHDLKKKYAIKIQDTTQTAVMAALITKPSSDVEDVLLFKINQGVSVDDPFNIESFPLPIGIYPPFNMPFEGIKGLCAAVAYHTTGLVAYNCPTEGAMSGSLLRTPEGLPFAIHLGSKGSLGYGLVLGSIRDDLRRKLNEI